MKRSEWAKQVAKLQARWPRQPVSPESAAIWFEDLMEFPAEQVEAAIVALYRDGREWAPNGAQIRLKVLELGQPAHDWGKAYKLAMDAAGPGGGAASGLAWLRERDPLAAEAASRFPWDAFCMETNDMARRAQFRDIFLEVAESAERHDRYRGIEPAGLKVLEQANDQPARFGDLVQLDPAARQLEAGEDAA